jgi:AbrB family looped-hinge helix DNA binding protein
MVAITVSSKYQIVIPRETREQLNITPGTRLLLSQDQDAISPCI